MDRYDEKKPVRNPEARDENDERTGDVLGLGGAAVPKEPGDPSTAFDEKSRAQRRQRTREPAAPGVSEPEDSDRGGGATGIDMGAGGTGTDIKSD